MNLGGILKALLYRVPDQESYNVFSFHTKQMFLSRYIVLNQYFMIGIV